MSYDQFKKAATNAQTKTFSLSDETLQQANELSARGYNVSAIVRAAITKAYKEITTKESSQVNGGT